jgi:hypothetical protein
MAEASLDLIQTMLQRVLDTQSRHSDQFHTVNERLAAIDKNLVMIRQRPALDAKATTLLGDRFFWAIVWTATKAVWTAWRGGWSCETSRASSDQRGSPIG